MIVKAFLITLKFIPAISTACCMLSSLLLCLGYENPMMNELAGLSVLAIIGLYVASLAFRFCRYHRLMLWYLLFNVCLTPHFERRSMLNYHKGNWYVGTAIMSLTITHAASIKTTSSKDHL